ncbi:phosphomannomutase/phosphoglucomutase [Legionella clemsonensis]|uniref:phosphomannomutase n=1 Tax=Legionella clemsonensis TaxID=1867846 RepID=A0A222P1C0_9GAMM|nr:phosphomannomutase/phosphoglucomutase [Legionella clemsonensis]ASQ45611.1 Phosphomannomutase/phosphoglucomutase [Legionella clemsonensis]
MEDLEVIKTASLGIFRSYDIRGVVGKYLNRNTYFTLGLVIGTELQELYKEDCILVCRDSRESSEAFSQALAYGLSLAGVRVINIGCLPTPLLYFAMNFLNCSSGVMVTASHNPINYNGLKVILSGNNYHGELLGNLYHRIVQQRYCMQSSSTVVIDHPTDELIAHYIKAVKKDVRLTRKFRVVVDCGNAVAGKVAPQLLMALGCEVIPLFCEVKTTFTNHHPDPALEENLKDLSRVVREENADLGVAFDGDGDRLGVVDNQGRIINADKLLLAFSAALLAQRSDVAVVFDVKCSQQLSDYITEHHGKAVMTKTGMAHIVEGMVMHQAMLGGEFCGHFYFYDRWLEHDDGIYAAARTLEILSQQFEDAYTFYNQFPSKVATGELKIAIAEHKKQAFMEQLLEQAPFIGGEVNYIDGLRVKFSNGWGLIRASNTTPCLTVRFEADTEKDLQLIQLLFRELILSINSMLELPF